jgi:RHS repeat-associated protein
VYNGDGLRTRREGNWGLTWDYIWDVAAGLPVILNEKDRHYTLDGETAGHGVNNTYVYGLDLISVTDKDGNQTYFLYDALGSTTDLTDSSGGVTTTYGYDVFGGLRSGSPGATEWLFTGEQLDAHEGLYYLRARYYDPEIGRFLGRDPLKVDHPYVYATNNPVNWTDPSGLDREGARCDYGELGAGLFIGFTGFAFLTVPGAYLFFVGAPLAGALVAEVTVGAVLIEALALYIEWHSGCVT